VYSDADRGGSQFMSNKSVDSMSQKLSEGAVDQKNIVRAFSSKPALVLGSGFSAVNKYLIPVMKDPTGETVFPDG